MSIDFDLPTAKRKPDAALGAVLVYARPKIGKTTLANEFDPAALHLDTEGSAKAIEGFVRPVSSWDEFRKAGALLAALPPEHPFRRTTIIDTVDALVPMCADDVIARLAGGAGQAKAVSRGKQFHHASDFEFGKGWAAILDEFSLRMGKLLTLVDNVILVSHEDIATVKDGLGRETHVARPDVSPKGVREWLLGTVNWIVYGHMQQTTDGQQRLLYLTPGDNFIAGGRAPRGVEVPPVIDFDGPTLRSTLEGLYAKPGDVQRTEYEGKEAPQEPAKPKATRRARKAPDTPQEQQEAPAEADTQEQQEELVV